MVTLCDILYGNKMLRKQKIRKCAFLKYILFINVHDTTSQQSH